MRKSLRTLSKECVLSDEGALSLNRVKVSARLLKCSKMLKVRAQLSWYHFGRCQRFANFNIEMHLQLKSVPRL